MTATEPTSAEVTTAQPGATSTASSTAVVADPNATTTTVRRNEKGEVVALDEPALLACSNNLFAFAALQTDDETSADKELAKAAERAMTSSVVEISAQALVLKNAVGQPSRKATVNAFLDMCAARGFLY